MTQDQQKQLAAQAALQYIKSDNIIGVGTGSTVNYFIDVLATIKPKIEGAVASSFATAERLKSHGIPVFDLNSVKELPVYIDGADEINEHKQMIKGGGGALTQEKIVATVAKQFICIADEKKFVPVLGNFPVAVEVISQARSYVARELIKLGGFPVYRENVVTDNGNIILDVYHLKLLDPTKVEDRVKNIVGVVENGIFSHRKADILLLATGDGVKIF